MSLGSSVPGVRSGFLETPRTDFFGVFLASAQTGSQSAVAGASTPRVRRRSEAVDVDHGQLVYPSLKDCPVVVGLHELSPVGRRATGCRDGRRLEWFAEMCQDLPDRPRIGSERDESDVTAMTTSPSCCPISPPQPPHFCRGTSAFLPSFISIPAEPVPFLLLFLLGPTTLDEPERTADEGEDGAHACRVDLGDSDPREPKTNVAELARWVDPSMPMMCETPASSSLQ